MKNFVTVFTKQPQATKNNENDEKEATRPQNHEATTHDSPKLALLKELLLPLDELVVQHEVETVEIDTDDFLNSERQQIRHYYISNNKGAQVLSAIVESIFCVRIGIGSVPHPKDGELRRLHPSKTKDDLMHLFHSVSTDGCAPWSLQMLEVFAPTKVLFGSVEQLLGLLYTEFKVNYCEDAVLHIQSQKMKRDLFQIFTNEGVQVGTIKRKECDHDQEGVFANVAFHLYINNSVSENIKLLLLAATIFIDWMFSEAPKFLSCG